MLCVSITLPSSVDHREETKMPNEKELERIAKLRRELDNSKGQSQADKLRMMLESNGPRTEDGHARVNRAYDRSVN